MAMTPENPLPAARPESGHSPTQQSNDGVGNHDGAGFAASNEAWFESPPTHADEFQRLGVDVASILRTAHQSAELLRQQVLGEAARIRGDAEIESQTIRSRADIYAAQLERQAEDDRDAANAARRTAEDEAETTIREAKAEAARQTEQARAAAEAIRAEARAEAAEVAERTNTELDAKRTAQNAELDARLAEADRAEELALSRLDQTRAEVDASILRLKSQTRTTTTAAGSTRATSPSEVSELPDGIGEDPTPPPPPIGAVPHVSQPPAADHSDQQTDPVAAPLGPETGPEPVSPQQRERVREMTENAIADIASRRNKRT